MDVHQEVMIRAVAEAGRKGEVRQRAGRCGFGLARRLRQLGVECEVVAPSLTSTRAGERIKTDRRDACKLARLLRAGELTPVYISEAHDEAMRDLCRARTDAVDDRRRACHRLKRLPTTRPFRPARPRAIPPMRFPEPTREG